MPINRFNQRVFHRKLYAGAGMLQTIELLKRDDDQLQGTVTSYIMYQCLLPGTFVEGNIVGASKSFYSGEVVELETLDGSSLFATINHPVLTPSGFVGAGTLKPGEYLVSDNGNVGTGSHNVKNTPTTIEQVFETFSKDGSFTRRPATFDLHGDGKSIIGDIEIVGPNWQLLDNGTFQTSKHRSDVLFSFGTSTGTGFSNVMSMSKTLSSTSNRCISSQSSTLSFCGGCSSVLDQLPFPTGSKSNTGFNKDVFRSYSKFAFEGVEGFTSKITVNNGLSGKSIQPLAGNEYISIGMGSRFNTLRSQILDERGRTDANFCGKLFSGFPGQVALDVVTKIRRFHYNGPVYDLEATHGYYTASSAGKRLFVSNCRRSMMHKTGETIAGEMLSDHRTVWHIPRTELERIGILYLNPADRIVEHWPAPNIIRTWQPESTVMIDIKLMEVHVCVACLLVSAENQ